MNILITGGSGFIGTVLATRLLEQGHRVRIFDKNQSAKHQNITRIGDIRDYAAVKSACSGMDAVIHLAAEHADDVDPISLYYEVNVDGARNIARACAASGIATLIFTSTVAVYGLNAGVANEDAPPAPFNDYGKSKYAAEAVLAEWAETNAGSRLVIIRPSVLFGENNRGNVYNLIESIQKGRFIMVGGGSNHKSMSYVENLVLFTTRVTAEARPGIAIYNYADQPDLTSGEIVSIIHDALGKQQPRFRIPYWIGILGGQALDLVAKLSGRRFPISAIRIKKFNASTEVRSAKARATGFEAPFSLRDGLTRMIEAEFGARSQGNHDPQASRR
jgi:GlcNAc-P-P-Und epimerase